MRTRFRAEYAAGHPRPRATTFLSVYARDRSCGRVVSALRWRALMGSTGHKAGVRLRAVRNEWRQLRGVLPPPASAYHRLVAVGPIPMGPDVAPEAGVLSRR